MISVHEAQQLIKENTSAGEFYTRNLYDSVGYAIAEDIVSPLNFPSFKQSAMDGYAFRFSDWDSENIFRVEQEIQAGELTETARLQKGEAVRIFTGAKVPDDADTIVMQEHTERNGNMIRITNENLKPGNNIRAIASQTKKGECIAQKGSSMTPGLAGLLSGLGIASVKVYTKPSCIILATGKELIAPGYSLQEGQIFESNSYALIHGLRQLHLHEVEIMYVDDDKEKIELAIENALQKTDMLLITGGVSVGDYDFVSKALETQHVKSIFHNVRQKPGKPLYFGKPTLNDKPKYIFGLPGNPGSVLTCFYEYVLPCLRIMMGFTRSGLPTLRLPLISASYKKQQFTHFLKGKISQDGVEILDHQESYKMNAFAEADCLIVVDEMVNEIQKGMLVDVHLLKF